MKNKSTLFVFIVLYSINLFSNNKFNSKYLLNLNQNNAISLSKLMDNKIGIGFVFFSPTCPICQNHILELNMLYEKYVNKGLEIALVLPQSLYLSKSQIINTIDSLTIKIPVFLDKKNKLTNYLHATVMPQAILIDQNFKIKYSGQISNKFISIGVKKSSNIEYFFENALDDFIQHRSIKNSINQPVGCIIEKFER